MPSEVIRYVLDQVRPIIPDGADVSDHIPTIKTLARPLVWAEFGEFEPLAEAPLSHIAATVDVCIVTNRKDMREGESDADTLVLGFYRDLLRTSAFYGVTARKAMFADTYLGWRVSVTIALSTEQIAQPTPPPA